MRLDEWLNTQPQFHTQFQDFLMLLKRRKIRGPDRCARETLLLLKKMLGSCRWSHTQEMMDYVREVGVALMDARPMELAIGSMVRRVLYIIREEFASSVIEASASEESKRGGLKYAMQTSLEGGLANKPTAVDYTVPCKNLMSNIMGAVQELEGELDSVHDAISDQAEDHIPDGAKILVRAFKIRVTPPLFLKFFGARTSQRIVSVALSFEKVFDLPPPFPYSRYLFGARLVRPSESLDPSKPSFERRRKNRGPSRSWSASRRLTMEATRWRIASAERASTRHSSPTLPCSR